MKPVLTEVPFQVVSVNVSSEKGIVKQPVRQARVLSGHGLENDAHAGPWHRQVSLLGAEDIEAFSRKHQPVAFGEFAENITTRGLRISEVAMFDVIVIGTVRIEITQIGKACHHGCKILEQVGACIMPKEGLFGRVLEGGSLAPGMPGAWLSLPLSVRVITLSDRASTGVYRDRSGPRIGELLREHYQGSRDHLRIEPILIPDDREQLVRQYASSVLADVDIVITTGGTGIGPRDIVPETTSLFCDRLIPGLMDHIRLKYGCDNPAARLSRSLAGIKRNTLILNLPGSVKAVEEYLAELMPMFDHIRRMIYGIDHH